MNEQQADTTDENDTGRSLRADARRNRARILEVAVEAFAAEGLSVPVQEIARRAGVGTGTVSRHFPTKEALFQAILLIRARRLIDEADRLSRSEEPGTAFFAFLARVVEEGAANRGLAEALTGAGFDFDAVALSEGVDIMGTLRGLLARAQQAGAVSGDIDTSDVKALIAGCLARVSGTADTAARDRMIRIACQGLRSL